MNNNKTDLRQKELTFELDIAMYKANSMHPADSSAEFAKDAAEKRLVNLGVKLLVRNKIKEFSTGHMFEHKDMIRRRAEGVNV